LSVGDGIARVFGLDNVQSGEMVEFENGTRGMALNLETDNVGIVISAPTRKSRKARPSSAPAAIVDTPSARACSGRVVDDARPIRSTARAIQSDKRMRV